MKIRAKFTLFTALVVAGTAASTGAFAYFLQKKLIEENLAAARRAQLAGFAAASRQALSSENDLFMVNYVKLLLETPGVSHAYFLEDNGRLRVHSDSRFYAKTAEEWAIERPADSFEESQEVALKDGAAGRAVLGFSRAHERRALERVRRRTLAHAGAAAGLAALAGLLASLYLAHRLTRPIRRLAESSVDIAAGRFDTRVEAGAADELGELSRRFNDMAARLAALDEMKDQFIASVSHDLRSPLSAIKMFADHMMGDKAEPPHPSHLLHLMTINESATRLNVFVSNILDTAKIKAGRMEYHKQPVQVDGLVSSLTELYGVMARNREIDLKTDLPADLPPVEADPERLEHVLSNFLSNALKITRAGGTVVVGGRAVGDGVEIFVQDTGPGIPAAELPKLFGQFQQLDGAGGRRVKGTGLGLSIVKKTIEDMGGRVGVESTEGKGARFWARLRRAEGTVAPAAGPAGDDASYKVLVVDDELAQARFAATLLTSLGHRPVLCPSAKDTMDWVAKEKPDFVLLDLMMPGMDGIEVLRALRDRPDTRGAPVLMYSTVREPGKVAEALAAGASDFLLKPLKQQELKQRVRWLMSR